MVEVYMNGLFQDRFLKTKRYVVEITFDVVARSA
jgi:hypothetical protein